MNGPAKNHISNWTTACLAIGLAIGLASCGGGGDSSPPPPLSVSVKSAYSTVAVGTSTQVTATVLNDSANQGVTWNVSCSGSDNGCGYLSTYRPASGVAG